jgi:hypothetical protein
VDKPGRTGSCLTDGIPLSGRHGAYVSHAKVNHRRCGIDPVCGGIRSLVTRVSSYADFSFDSHGEKDIRAHDDVTENVKASGIKRNDQLDWDRVRVSLYGVFSILTTCS